MVLPAPLGPSTTQRSSSSTRQDTSRSRSASPRVTVARSTRDHEIRVTIDHGAIHARPRPARPSDTRTHRQRRAPPHAQAAEERLHDRHGGGGAGAALLHEDRERDVALPADRPGVGVAPGCCRTRPCRSSRGPARRARRRARWRYPTVTTSRIIVRSAATEAALSAVPSAGGRRPDPPLEPVRRPAAR